MNAMRCLMLATALLCACAHDTPRPSKDDAAPAKAPAPPPRDSVFVATFLQFLGADLPGSALRGGYDESKGGHWNTDSTLAFLSDSGVTFTDVNKKKPWHTSIDTLRAELKARSGKSYGYLVHLGNTAAEPYQQYSRLEFKQAGDSTFAILGDELYRVVLVRERGSVRVVRIEYLQLHDL